MGAVGLGAAGLGLGRAGQSVEALPVPATYAAAWWATTGSWLSHTYRGRAGGPGLRLSGAAVSWGHPIALLPLQANGECLSRQCKSLALQGEPRTQGTAAGRRLLGPLCPSQCSNLQRTR